MKSKEIIIVVILAVIVISVIYAINYFKPNTELNEEIMQCIADNSILIVSKTCGHCANQKEILGPYLDKFDIQSVDDNPTLLNKYHLRGIPAWIINDKAYTGVKSVNELKELTNC